MATDFNLTIWLDCNDRMYDLLSRALTLAEGEGKVKLTRMSDVVTPLENAGTPAEKKTIQELAKKANEMEAPETTDESLEMKKEEPLPFNNNLTKVQLREAMDACCARLEAGLDEDKKALIHKQAIKEFRKLAKSLGYEKPTELPEGNLRGQFVEKLDGFHVEDNAVIPF